MQRTTIDFGIDLGTTNSTIAVIHDGGAVVIPNKGGSGITPSAVWIDKRGSLHVGEEAKKRALIDDQENGDLEFKLRMGLGDEGKKVFVRSGREMFPEELSAEVLKSLKMDVQTNMGEQVRAVVITVPAAFELPQTQATQKAAQLAGFALSPLLPEPVAASLAYGCETSSENVYWLVYDFGGGTFDAAVMRVREGLIQVVNHDGNNHLGGKLIDWDIVTRKLVPAIAGQFSLPEFTRGNPRWKFTFGKMKYYAELAKIEVCRTKAPYEVFVEGLCEDADGKSVDLLYTLTPEDVEQVSRPYIEQSLGLCRKTLKDKGLTGSNLERVLMVGGTSLSPWVREAVQAELGSKLEFGIDPVTVVARGAALFAGTKLAPKSVVVLPAGTWQIEFEYEPVGNVHDPDIGGRVIPPDGQNLADYAIEFVDTKTKWRSGRTKLGADGVFMTQLYADEKRQCEFCVELSDATGTLIPTSPGSVSYTFRPVVPDRPPASYTIGVGLADGTMMPYIKKGTGLPAHNTIDHNTVVSLRAGIAEDILRIPLLEGERLRARRNHGIGVLSISGSDIHRDLPAGSQVNITIRMDESQQTRMQVYVPVLDEDFEMKVDLKMQRDSLDVLSKEADEQRARLVELREKIKQAGAPKADAAMSRIASERLPEEIDSLVDAARQDSDARSQLDRRLRDMAAALDDVEDSIEWPELLKKAEAACREADQLVKKHGTEHERSAFRMLEGELKRAMDALESDMVRQYVKELWGLFWYLAERDEAIQVWLFSDYEAKKDKMSDRDRAEKLFAQGRRAINNRDLVALVAANRQLWGLLPIEERSEMHKNVGGVQ